MQQPNISSATIAQTTPTQPVRMTGSHSVNNSTAPTLDSGKILKAKTDGPGKGNMTPWDPLKPWEFMYKKSKVNRVR